MLLYWWSPLIFLFQSRPVPLSILWWLYRVRQPQLISPSLSCSIVCLFLNSLTRSRNLSLFTLSFGFSLWSARTAKFTIQQVLFFLFIITKPGRLDVIKWSVCISKSEMFLRLILQNRFWVGHILFVHMVKFRFLA